MRLPQGSDTVAGIRAKHAFVEQELAQWIDAALSTDHDDATAVALPQAA